MNNVRSPAAAPPAPAQGNAVGPKRLLFIDNLRWTMIVLVITMHAAVTYSNMGRWYYNEKASLDRASFLFFATYQSWLQAFFMGLLFFIAGYFVPAKFDSKGTARFLRDRAIRLGIPTLLYMLVIGPATIYFLLVRAAGAHRSFWSWWVAYVTGPAIRSGGTGPLWFCLALLIFCSFYAAVRLTARRTPSNTPWIPGDRSVIALIAAMAASTFLVRVAQPVGTAIYNMQLCYFADYVILFMAGIHAARHGWLTTLPRILAARWMRIGVIGGAVWWFAMLAVAMRLNLPLQPFNGGLHWESALVTGWEALFATGMCIGLVVIFRERFNGQNAPARFLSDNAFAVYVLHPPMVIGLALALRGWHAAPVLKFVTVSTFAAIMSFLVAAAVRIIRPVRTVL